ncbi:MAG: hypothetical protein M1821_000430 [Bathelium mastoideum]|nr:MAG: hypothetical protein M1821_000430 [Bathelium mastoideum]KAI9686241.1 MAG: hypothetical protein M1822_003897 [Bathelium mastoideum]
MSTPHTDPVFRSFTAEQAQTYALGRPSYVPELFQFIFDHHASHGGVFHKLLDVGCGPGKATRDMSSRFDEVIGADPGEQMIEQARKLGGSTKTGKPIQFVVSSAEALDKIAGLEEESVDLLTAATSAHWFTMSEFWPVAAKVMKPGGTIAMWCPGPVHCHPAHPRAAIVTERMEQLRATEAGDGAVKGNHTIRNQYRDLELPWQTDPPVSAFPEEKFLRQEWDYDDDFGDRDDFLGGSRMATIEQIQAVLITSSTFVRWRRAHPDLVGTDEDLLVRTLRNLREAAGMAPDENGTLPLGHSTTLLLFQKA